MHRIPIARILSLSLVAVLVLGGGSVAQTPPPPGQVSQEDLDSFAKAYAQVEEVQRKYVPKLENAEPSDAANLQQEAQQESLQVLKDEGLSAERYNQIATMIQADPALRTRVLEKVEEHR
jgi:siroheme synthase (precorrin-2 oxidase/ferrochelatase)